MKFLERVILITAFLSITYSAQATVKPNSLFSDNMILQRDIVVPIWGTANDGETVSVEFNGQTLTTTATNGKWFVKLAPMPANSTPLSMIIKGENSVTIKNVLVGEVWLCSGQSNMAFPLRAVKPVGNYPIVDSVLANAHKYPLIRQFKVPLGKRILQPMDDVKGKWSVCNATTAKEYSAVAYFFAKDLFDKLQIPIGIINSSYGGTPIENWMRQDILEADPELKLILERYQKAASEHAAKLEAYKNQESALLEKFCADSTAARQANKELPRKPTAPVHPGDRGGPTGLYNSMIAPLIPFAMRGVVWYQGEANTSRAKEYANSFPKMIAQWREEWQQGDFPFLFVQIPGWKNHYPEFREAQAKTWRSVPNISMTVTYDCDDTLDVHPGNKQPIGERLALAARALAYKEKKEYMGPIYEKMDINADKITLYFSHAEKGLQSKNGDLQDFIIAGADKKFVPAKAKIQGNTVIVYSEMVKNPTAVRLGWRLCPQANLYNSEGLPVSPFRTDME